jgi:Ca-activated chloride channel family protein
MHRSTDRFLSSRSTVLRRALFIIIYCLFTNNYAEIIQALPSAKDTDRSSPEKQQSAQKGDSSEQKGGYKVGVNVDLVMMYASVFDQKDRFISGLKKEDFTLYEDGAKQEIAYFSQIDIPVTIGIVLDLSGSMEGKMEQVNRAARAFIQSSNPKDQVFLIGFNDEVDLLQGFTSDIDEISDALENAVTMGGTALYDAVHLGVEEARKGDKSKKALVVISDGEDKDSFYSLKDLVSFVQESDVQIFDIGFLDKVQSKTLFGGWFKTDAEKARDALMRISEESGGKAYFPEEVSDIHNIVSEIAAELRHQYSIGYFSSNADRDGSWRRVMIRLDTKAVSDPQLRYRRGYYAPKE